MVQSYRDRRVGGWRIWNPQYLGAQWNFVFYFFFPPCWLFFPSFASTFYINFQQRHWIYIIAHFNFLCLSFRCHDILYKGSCNLQPWNHIITYSLAHSSSLGSDVQKHPSAPAPLLTSHTLQREKICPIEASLGTTQLQQRKKRELRKCQSPAHVVWVAHSL